MWLTLLSIGIATMGLYGLIIFYLGKRNKEISLRKVNGASVAEIILLLNTDFIRWVVISVIIAFPVAWYAMNNWLINFAYKTNLIWWIFILSGILILTIVSLTVTLQSWRIATRNPVEALRYE
jgi:putative ABC transport system permease protein